MSTGNLLHELDEQLATAIRRGLERWPLPSRAFQRGQEEMWRISECEMARYDEPGLPPLYASWYHPRRVALSLASIGRLLRKTEPGQSIRVLDLGCGTAPFLWALARSLQGMPPEDRPDIEYIGVDDSRSMIRWAGHLAEHLHPPDCLSREFSVARWQQASTSEIASNWIVASYLLPTASVSDAMAEALVARIISIAKGSRDARVLLQTAAAKRRALENVRARFERQGWRADPLPAPELRGECHQLNTLRHQMGNEHGFSPGPRSVNLGDLDGLTGYLLTPSVGSDG